MTAPLPAPRVPPVAGLFNDLVAHLNRRLAARVVELELLLRLDTERNHELIVAADFAASDAAGYIDRTGLEA